MTNEIQRKTLEILVVEDNPQHLVDAQATARQYLKIQQLEKRGMVQADRELLLYSGTFKAKKLLERLEEFESPLDRRKKLIQLTRFGIITQTDAREMNKLISLSGKKSLASTRSETDKKGIIELLERGGLSEQQIISRLQPYGYEEDFIREVISAG